MSGIVAIVGRPNVGKSTFFNRLIGERQAIVHNESGVTRDRHYGKGEWLDQQFTVIDTGGFVPHTKDIFEIGIKKQVEIALQEANVLIFMVDVTTEVTDIDIEFARIIRRAGKPVVLAVNKVDNSERMNDMAPFYALGFDHVFPLSSTSGGGSGDLLDKVVEYLPKSEEEEENPLPRITLVGRPNVGKSSLCNALLQEERTMVTDVAGTTRDTIDTMYKGYGQVFILVDTAGIRKKGKVHENIEFYSVMRAIKAVEQSDVVMLLIDATRGIAAQDLNLIHLAQRNGKGLMILINKWDLVEKNHQTAIDFTKNIKTAISPFTDVPILFISATEKLRIFKAVETAIDVYNNLKRKISTSKINDYILPIIEKTPPPAKRGRYIRIKYVTQLKTNKVSFAFFCNYPKYIEESYKRFLENKLREQFNFEGIPIQIYFRKK